MIRPPFGAAFFMGEPADLAPLPGSGLRGQRRARAIDLIPASGTWPGAHALASTGARNVAPDNGLTCCRKAFIPTANATSGGRHMTTWNSCMPTARAVADGGDL